jgi:hypothetical protein
MEVQVGGGVEHLGGEVDGEAEALLGVRHLANHHALHLVLAHQHFSQQRAELVESLLAPANELDEGLPCLGDVPAREHQGPRVVVALVGLAKSLEHPHQLVEAWGVGEHAEG